MAGSAKGVVKIRIVADDEAAQRLAADIMQTLNRAGYSLIEWTESIPCRPPEEDRSRVYMTALAKTPAG